jgi:Ca2+-binding RTX toxin-like protein
MATLNVPAPFPTIAAAVAVAAPGDTILIASGYAGNEAVNVPVNNLIFSAPADVPGIVLTATGATVRIQLADASPIQINGSAGNNVFVGNSGANVITDGGGGNDLLYGAGADDTLSVTGGTDSVNGGMAGSDVLIVDYSLATAGVTASAATASDGGTRSVSWTNIERLHIIGGSGADFLQGGAGIDTMVGNGGNDTFAAAGGTHTLQGGGGDDFFFVSGGTGTVDGGANSDTVQSGDLGGYGFANVELLDIGGSYVVATVAQLASFSTITDGTDPNSQIFMDMSGSGGAIDFSTRMAGAHGLYFNDSALTGAVTVTGSANDDVFTGSTFADTVFGGGGDDLFFLRGGLDSLDGGAGIDTIAGSDIDEVQFGSVEVLDTTFIEARLAQLGSFATITDSGSGASQVVMYVSGAGGGLNFMNRMEGAHSVYFFDNGLTSGVTVTGSANDDVLSGSSFSDLFIGDDGNDSINGGAENDYLAGGDGLDSLFGGNGRDLLSGGAGADFLAGGEGNDAYSVDHVGDAIDETSAGSSGSDLVYVAVNDYHVGEGVEGIRVTDAAGLTVTADGTTDNVFVGGIGSDRLDGGAGNDVIYGETGSDTLFGGLGNDRLTGGDGVDTLTGGSGNDAYFVDNNTDQVAEGALGGADAVFATVDYELAGGQEVEILRVSGTDGLALSGNELANTLIGGTGTDTLYGGDGLDRLFGGDGADRLYGGLHNDRLEGGSGDDTVQGGLGNDTLTAGTGVDTFLYSAGDGDDRFSDFSAAQGDRVDLTGVTVSNIAGNVATLNDGSVLTAQVGYVWTMADFI